ncbi:MAG: DeoR/GlpR family DNA-binding transcription regulator [Rhodospirillales bacterium]|nr:DeoR/GlpR family DNA-binding transcription regulator [Rhodospirillales bacterium]
MENSSPRQLEIVKLARTSGRVSVEELVETFEVSPQTIRKDLNDLCGRGILKRVHGGAMLRSGVSNQAYESRRMVAAEEKSVIGAMAASLVPNNCSLLINIGTTTEQVALALRGKENLMVVTNNINVVNILHNEPGIDIIVTGGIIRRSDSGVVGDAAVEMIKRFKVDYAVIGVSAIDADGALLDYDYREVQASQAIIENARHVILVADSLKFERSAPVRIGHLSQLDTFVTNGHPPKQITQICKENDVELIST